MRLTKKRADGHYDDLDECVSTRCSDKLGKLEDIEDELGIDLVTLFKAVSCGCYLKDKNGKVAFSGDVSICYKYVVIVYDKEKYFMWNVNYGKTWALTKEELQ